MITERRYKIANEPSALFVMKNPSQFNKSGWEKNTLSNKATDLFQHLLNSPQIDRIQLEHEWQEHQWQDAAMDPTNNKNQISTTTLPTAFANRLFFKQGDQWQLAPGAYAFVNSLKPWRAPSMWCLNQLESLFIKVKNEDSIFIKGLKILLGCLVILIAFSLILTEILIDALPLGGPFADWLADKGAKRWYAPGLSSREPLQNTLLKEQLSVALRAVWFLLFVPAVAFIVFNCLTYFGVMAAPFAFMASTTSTLLWLIGTNLAASLIPLLITPVLGTLYGLLRHTVFYRFTQEGQFYGVLYQVYQRAAILHDTIELGTLISAAAAALLIAASVLNLLGAAPAVAGVGFVVKLTGVFGPSLVAHLTATTVFAGLTLLAGRIASLFFAIIPVLVTDAIKIRGQSLTTHYKNLRGWFVDTFEDINNATPARAKHPRAAQAGFLVGTLLGAAALTLGLLFEPTLVASSLTFWGPLLVGTSLISGGALLMMALFVTLAHHWQPDSIPPEDRADGYCTSFCQCLNSLLTCSNAKTREKEAPSQGCLSSAWQGLTTTVSSGLNALTSAASYVTNTVCGTAQKEEQEEFLSFD